MPGGAAVLTPVNDVTISTADRTTTTERMRLPAVLRNMSPPSVKGLLIHLLARVVGRRSETACLHYSRERSSPVVQLHNTVFSGPVESLKRINPPRAPT